MDPRPTAAGPAADPAPPVPRPAPRGLVFSDDEDRTGVWLALVAAFVLRFWNLGGQGLWTDEGTAWTAASLPLRELIDFCLHKDASPPLFYILTGLSLKLGGGEAHVRAVSAIASTVLVWVTYRFARLLASRRTATLAAALLAFSPFQLLYAQEARTYALVALWAVAGQYLFARAILLERPRAFAPWVALTTLGLYTQSIALLGVLAQGAFALATAAGRRNLGRFVLGLGIAGALYLPWFLAGLSGSPLGSSHWYVEGPALKNTVHVLRAVFLSPIPLVTPLAPSTLPGLDAVLPRPLAWVLLFGPTAAALLLALPRLRDPGHRGLLARFTLAAIAIPLVAVFVVSLKRPLWLPRYFVFLGPMVALLLALGVSTLARRWAAMGLAAALLIVSAYASFRVSVDYTKERWRDVARLVAGSSDPARTAVIVTFDPDPFLYYDSRFATSFPVFAAAHPDVPFHDRYTPEQFGAVFRALSDSTRRFDEVWVVVRSPNSEARQRLARFANAAASLHRVPVLRDTLLSAQGPLRLTRWVSRPGGDGRRLEMKAAEAWADSVTAGAPPARAPLAGPFTAGELAVDPDTLGLYLRRLPDRSFFSHYGDEDEPYTWWIAAERLGSLGPGVIPALVERVDAPDPHERMLVHYALMLASQDGSVLARTHGEAVSLVGVLDRAPHDRNAAIARAWWEKHRRLWDEAR